MVTVRLNKLNEASKLYQFCVRLMNLQTGLTSIIIQVASSEEYGHDFEHLQVTAMRYF